MGRREKRIPLEGKTPLTLGASLRQARQTAGISLTEMADRLGYTKSHLSAVETDVGRPSQDLLEKYAQELEISLDELTQNGSLLVSGQQTVPASLATVNQTRPRTELLRLRYVGLLNWGGAPPLGNFYGRLKELEQLTQWIVEEDCHVVGVFGMGGMGKTMFAAKLYDQIKEHKGEGQFDYALWFSLKSEPSLESILKKCIQVFSNQQQTELAEEEDEQIAQLLECFREHRCLLVLDNVESVLESRSPTGQYKDGYKGYGKLILQVGEIVHQSCLLLTSREQLKEVIREEGKTSPVRFLQLPGLEVADARKILDEKNVSGSDRVCEELIKLYKGNPLVLKLVCSSIKAVFGGNVDRFMQEKQRIFGDLRTFIDEQFGRLSDLEAEIVYWLAIEQEPVSVEDLYRDLVNPRSKAELYEFLEALQRRSMIETPGSGQFTLQPVIMEYVINRLIEQMFQEIASGEIGWLVRYALIQAQAKDYIREIQERLILNPLIDRLGVTFRKRDLEERLKHILARLRDTHSEIPAYAAGNILNLLVHLQVNLQDYDFSGLVVRQAYLPGVLLPEVDFRDANLEGSVFTDAFGSILSVAFSPDGHLLAAGTSHSEIRLWRLQDRTPLRTCYGHRGWVWSVAFSPDGKYLASGSEDATVRVWDVNTGQSLETLKGHNSWVRCVAFSPDSRLLASGSEDCTIRLWEVESDPSLKIRLLDTLRGHESWVRTVAFSPDGRYLASGSEDQTIRLWDVCTGECLKTLKGHQNRVRSIAFSLDGRLASCGEDEYLYIWDQRRDWEPQKFPLPGGTNRIVSLTFNPDGNLLATGEGDGKVRIWDANTGERIETLEGHTNWIRAVAFSPDGQILASGSEDQTVRLWEVKSFRCLKTLQGYSNWMWSVAFGKDESILASGGEDKTVQLWDVNTGKPIRIMHGHANRVWSVALSPDKNILASGSEDQTIRLWKVSTGQCLKSLLGHTHRVRSVAFSPGGGVLASGSEDQTVRLWDVNTGECFNVLKGHDHMIWSIAFSPNGRLLASGSADKTICIWDVDSGEPTHVLQADDVIWAVAFNDDGSLLASGGDDHTIRLWDVSTGECHQVLQGHRHRIHSVAFSPDGRYLASGSHDQTVRIWEVSTGQCVYVLEGHTSRVWSVSFSYEGQRLASCSEDGTIRIWNVETGKCLDVLRSERPYEDMKIAGVRGLTPAQIDTLITLGATEE